MTRTFSRNVAKDEQTWIQRYKHHNNCTSTVVRKQYLSRCHRCNNADHREVDCLSRNALQSAVSAVVEMSVYLSVRLSVTFW